MKTLVDPVIKLDGDKITIDAKISDVPFNALLVTRVSHMHHNADNIKHHRRIQSSSAAVFVESAAGKFAISNSLFAAIAAHAMPETSFAPVFKSGSTPNKVSVVSETPVTIKWQVSDNAFPIADKPNTPPPAAVWVEIAGANSESLDDSLVKSGQWIRCVATNLAGQTFTKPVQKK